MSYRFARVRENYADLASGHVLRSAPGFQKRMIPSLSAAIIASEFVARTASAIVSEKLMSEPSQETFVTWTMLSFALLVAGEGA